MNTFFQYLMKRCLHLLRVYLIISAIGFTFSLVVFRPSIEMISGIGVGFVFGFLATIVSSIFNFYLESHPVRQNRNSNIPSTVPFPPKIPEYLLYLLVSSRSFREMLIGDLFELYRQNYTQLGSRRANIWYWNEVIKSIPFLTKGYILDQFQRKTVWSNAPAKDYLRRLLFGEIILAIQNVQKLILH